MSEIQDGLPNPESPKTGPSKKSDVRPIYKKKRFIIPAALVLLIAISSAGNAGKDDNSVTPSSTPDSSISTDDVTPEPSDSETEEVVEPTPEETEEANTETISQMNAREKALDYLAYSAFSKKGLIDQLEFEGFSTKDAEYAVSAIDVDWNEQAAKKAADYLEYSSFSKQGLIDQLIFEGFTQSQAAYGVKTTGL